MLCTIHCTHLHCECMYVFAMCNLSYDIQSLKNGIYRIVLYLIYITPFFQTFKSHYFCIASIKHSGVALVTEYVKSLTKI